MKEQLITFETAELAKKKGFNWGVLAGFNVDNILINFALEGGYTDWNQSEITTSLPTQSLLQKWLRDIHSIYVLPIPLNDERRFYFDVTVIEIQNYPIEIDFGCYSDNLHTIEVKTYEEALEFGLFEALKLI